MGDKGLCVTLTLCAGIVYACPVSDKHLSFSFCVCMCVMNCGATWRHKNSIHPPRRAIKKKKQRLRPTERKKVRDVRVK